MVGIAKGKCHCWIKCQWKQLSKPKETKILVSDSTRETKKVMMKEQKATGGHHNQTEAQKRPSLGVWVEMKTVKKAVLEIDMLDIS